MSNNCSPGLRPGIYGGGMLKTHKGMNYKRWYDEVHFFKKIIIVIIAVLLIMISSFFYVDNKIFLAFINFLSIGVISVILVLYAKYVVDVNLYMSSSNEKANKIKIEALESSLNEKKTTFRYMFNNSPYMHFVVKKETERILKANKNAANVLGVSDSSELINRRIVEFVYREDIELYKKAWNNIITKKSGYVDVDYRMVTMNGAIIYIKDRIVSLGVEQVYSISHNNTKYLNVVNRLKEQKANFSSIFSNASVGIFVISENKIIDCNKKAVDILGYSREEIIGKHPWNLSPKQQPSGVMSEIEAVKMIELANTNGSYKFPWVYSHKYKGNIYTKICLIPTIFNREKQIYATIIDVTELHKQKEELDTERKKLMTFINQSPMGIVSMAVDKNIDYINQSFGHMFNLDIEEFRNKPGGIKKFIGIVPEDILVGINNLFNNEIQFFKKNFKYKANNESDEWFSVYGFNVMTDSIVRIATILMFNDISEIMNTSLELQLAKHRLNNLFDVGNDGIIEIDKHFDITSVNKAVKKMFKIKNIKNFNIYSYIHPLEKQKAMAWSMERIKNKDTEPFSRKVLVAMPNGEEFVIKVNSVIRFDNDGNFLGIHGVVKRLKINPEVYKKTLIEKENLKNNLLAIANDSGVEEKMALFISKDILEDTLKEGIDIDEISKMFKDSLKPISEDKDD